MDPFVLHRLNHHHPRNVTPLSLPATALARDRHYIYGVPEASVSPSNTFPRSRLIVQVQHSNSQPSSSTDRVHGRRRQPQPGPAAGGAGAVAVDAQAGADTDPGVHLQQRDGEPAQGRDRAHPQAPRALRRRRRRQRFLLVPEPPLPLPPPPAPAPGAGAGPGTGAGAGVRGLLWVATRAWRPRLGGLVDFAGAVRARRRRVQLVLLLVLVAALAAVGGDGGGDGPVRGRRRPVRHLAADGVRGRRGRGRLRVVVVLGGRGAAAAAAALLLVPTCGHHGVHQRSGDGGATGPHGPALHVRARRDARPLHRRPPPRRRLRRAHAELADGRELLPGREVKLIELAGCC